MKTKAKSKNTGIGFDYKKEEGDFPATQRMLHLVRTELKSEMKAGFRAVDSKLSAMDSKFSGMDSKFSTMDSKLSAMDSKFSSMDSKFSSMDSKLNAMDSKISSMDSKISAMDSKISQISADVARIGILVEEQNSRNKIVLEGLTGLWQRQNRVETRVDDIEKMVQEIGRPKY